MERSEGKNNETETGVVFVRMLDTRLLFICFNTSSHLSIHLSIYLLIYLSIYSWRDINFFSSNAFHDLFPLCLTVADIFC